MGRERSGTGKYLYVCTAGLILIMLTACWPPGRTVAPAQERGVQPERVQHLLDPEDCESALRENQEILELFPQSPPGDVALFNLGIIHVHYANPDRDYKKALDFFARLESEFPGSPRAEEAKVWAGVLEAMVTNLEQKSRTQLESMQQLLTRGDFEGALRENEKAFSLSPKRPPADAALFNLGLIHVHYANPKRDIGKAMGYFTKIVKDFPGSPLMEEARIWAGILETMEKTKQIDVEIEEKKKILRR
jgi:tetratricopeptide (TPR) repeat protein